MKHSKESCRLFYIRQDGLLFIQSNRLDEYACITKQMIHIKLNHCDITGFLFGFTKTGFILYNWSIENRT